MNEDLTMREYEVSITISLTVRAAGQGEARDRAVAVAEAALAGIEQLGGQPWLGAPDYTTMVGEGTP